MNKYIFKRDLLGYFYTNNPKVYELEGIPHCDKVESYPSENDVFLPIDHITSCKFVENCWFHCFVNDSINQRFWNNYFYYLPLLKKAKGVVCFDFSIYRNDSKDLQVENVYKNGVMFYRMKEDGINVIPTAGFANEESWNWCFNHLPKNSVVAVTTNNVTARDKEGRRLFVGGFNAMIERIKPPVIIIYGVVFDWIYKKYPQIKIIHIKSFCEKLHELNRYNN